MRVVKQWNRLLRETAVSTLGDIKKWNGKSLLLLTLLRAEKVRLSDLQKSLLISIMK